MSSSCLGPLSIRRVASLVVSVLTLLALSVACRPTPTPLPPTPTPAPTPTVKAGPATLRIDIQPHGAGVRLDGAVQGRSPVTLTLQAGTHALLIEQEGFAALQETLELEPGGEAMIAGVLADIEPPQVTIRLSPQQPVVGQVVSITVEATDNIDIRQMDLLVDGQTLKQSTGLQGPMQTVGVAWAADTAGHHVLTVRAWDAEGNTSERVQSIAVGAPPTPSPTRVGTPTAPRPSPTSVSASPTPTAMPIITATVSVDTLNVRSGPAVQFTRVSSLSRGDEVSVLSRSSDASWLLVRAPDGREGWVSCALVVVSVPLGAIPLAADVPALPAEAQGSAASPTVSASETVVAILTYPYETYVRRVEDPDHGNVPLLVLDRAAYEAANPRPEPRDYKLVVLENEFLRLTILPELGGRIYECIFKPTGHNQFYRNPVIKPTRWGPSEPEGANWWLAVGGMEWALPVEEHGYEWSLPWNDTIARNSDGSATVTLTDGDGQRLKTMVEVTLRPGMAAFGLKVTLENASGAAVPYQFWSNAMLAPGGENRPSEGLQFVFPASEMKVHSTGDPRMGGAGAVFTWPFFAGQDVSRLSTWREYLGFFVRPGAQEGFVGVYDHAADEGILRVFPLETVRGAKGFAFGWGETAIRPDNWTDDNSGYVELHGGVTPTFWDWAELPPGQSLSWEETWFPATGLGGVLYADELGALNLEADGERLQVRLFATRRLSANLRITAGETVVFDEGIQVSAGDVFGQIVALPAETPPEGPFAITLSDPEDGTVYMAMSPRTLVRH
jgi:hypothetical protein